MPPRRMSILPPRHPCSGDGSGLGLPEHWCDYRTIALPHTKGQIETSVQVETCQTCLRDIDASKEQEVQNGVPAVQVLVSWRIAQGKVC